MSDWQLIGPWAPGVEWSAQVIGSYGWLWAVYPDGSSGTGLFECSNFEYTPWMRAEQASVQLVAEWL